MVARGSVGARRGVNGDVFAALSDPTRRQVVEALGARDELTATELAAELPVTRQAVAKHLAQLHAAGLVKGRRAGRETRYRLTPAPLGEAIDWMRAVGARTDGRVPPADPRERRAGGP